MNKQETMKILATIRSVYGSSDSDNIELQVAIWQKVFPEPMEMVADALKKHIQTSKFSPKPADLREIMYGSLVNAESAETAWDTARRFWQSIWPDDYSQELKDRYNSELPEKVRQIISLDEMRNICKSSATDVTSYEKPRFLKRYRELQDQQKREAISSNRSMLEIAQDMAKAIEAKPRERNWIALEVGAYEEEQ
jgi:hypothetical protein